MQDVISFIQTNILGFVLGFITGAAVMLASLPKESREIASEKRQQRRDANRYDGTNGNGYQPLQPEPKPLRVPGEWTRHTEHHFSTLLDGDVLAWWPSTQKFRYRGVTRLGDPEAFIEDYNRKRVAGIDTRNLRS